MVKIAALYIMELLKIDPGHYITMSCRSVSMRKKCPSIYTITKPQRKLRNVLRHFKKKAIRQKHWN